MALTTLILPQELQAGDGLPPQEAGLTSAKIFKPLELQNLLSLAEIDRFGLFLRVRHLLRRTERGTA